MKSIQNVKYLTHIYESDRITKINELIEVSGREIKVEKRITLTLYVYLLLVLYSTKMLSTNKLYHIYIWKLYIIYLY